MSDNVRGTLLQVTKRKFENLKAEKHRFDEQHEKSLKNAKHQENAVERLNAFIEDIEGMKLIDDKSVDSYSRHPDFKLVKEILRQAQYDTAITEKIIQGWQERLEQRLIQYGLRFDCALLFNDLVMKCVESGTSDSQEDGKKNEKVARKEMYEQRKEWESLAFSKPTIDVQRINSYLGGIFEAADKPEKAGYESPLHSLRNSIKQTCDNFPCFDEFVVKSCIDGILNADLFAGEKRDNLRDLKKHSNILEEIANILNQDLDSLDHWSWADGYIELDMRRHINGKYRVYMDEEIYQAIFLHHIGNEWSKQLLGAFTFFRDKVWTFQSESPLDIKSKQKRQERGCGDKPTNLTVNKHRSQVYKSNYWLLPLKEQSALRGYIDDDDVTSKGQAKSSFTDLKQGILRLITAEMQVQNEIYQSFTVWQSDFRWFGPSLPHETIFAVLKFLGMNETWLNFMRKFLTPTVKFKMDGKDGMTKKRSNGMPIAHQLCTVFGESIMFVLDYAVNQNTAGGNLYRIHDDLWFWGQQLRCQTAWKTLEKFVDIMGLKLNEEKTAAITVSAPSENKSQKGSLNIDNAELPWGKVRWGFLVLNGEALQWDIDQEQLEKHLEEFQLQLNATSSLIGWIRVWNSYVSSFFANNFGKPAICLGARHVKICMEAFEVVQKKLFGEKGNLATYVGSRIKSENDNAEITDASVYFPKRVGGLEAHNPLIKLSALSALEETEIQDILKNAWDNCKNDFDSLKKRWEEKESLKSLSTESHTPRPFLDWKEYISFLEDTDTNFGWRYERLMEDCSTSFHKLDGIIFEQNHLRGLKQFEKVIDSKNDPYWHRILALYGEEAVDRFGTLALADSSNLPLGVVDYLFSEKVRWQG